MDFFSIINSEGACGALFLRYMQPSGFCYAHAPNSNMIHEGSQVINNE